MSSNPIFFAPLRVPVTDPATGLMSRAWYLFFQAMFDRVGGSTGTPSDDIEQIAIEDFDIPSSDQIASAQLLSDAQANALDDSLVDPPSTDAADALALMLDSLDSTTGAAAPTAKVGLTAVNGSATTFMRSDAAPPLDQGIVPTMTGLWTFNGKVVVAAPAAGVAFSVTNVGSNAGNPPALFTCTTPAGFCTLHSNGTNTSSGTGFNSGNEFQVGTFGAFKLQLVVNNVVAADFTVAASPACTFKGPIGVNGNTPPAQVTGWGTPTGPAVVANFPGATATLVQCSNAIAQIIKDIKALGPYGA